MIINPSLKLIAVVSMSSISHAATVYSIDINDADNSLTELGWTGLEANNSSDGGSVIVGGINFSIGSSDGARLRGSIGSPNPDALVGDFAYDEGSASSAIILFFGGAGDLEAGLWQVEVWSHDATTTIGDQTVGYRTNTTETETDSSVAMSATGPISTFTFTSDGTSAYDVYIRENNTQNKTRLNAVRLTLVPEPSSTALLGLGGLALLLSRRKI